MKATEKDCSWPGGLASENVAYHVRAFRPGRSVPHYFCQGRSMDCPQPVCQWVPGIPVDQAVGDLLLEIMTPVTIDISLAVRTGQLI